MGCKTSDEVAARNKAELPYFVGEREDEGDKTKLFEVDDAEREELLVLIFTFFICENLIYREKKSKKWTLRMKTKNIKLYWFINWWIVKYHIFNFHFISI